MSPRTGTVWGTGIAVALLAVGVALLVALAPGSPGSDPAEDVAAATEVVPLPPSALSGGTGVDEAPEGAVDVGELDVLDGGSATASAPASVSVPRLGIESSLDGLRSIRDGTLESPRRWQVAGWYADGPRPGETGPAVIAGHVDSPSGPAVFADLDRIVVGDTIRVESRDGGTVEFRVDRLDVAPRDGFPTEAVYGPTPDPQLRLITCDGPYDANGGGYRDNLIVYATAVNA